MGHDACGHPKATTRGPITLVGSWSRRPVSTGDHSRKHVVLAASAAFSKDVGLIITFGGIGVIVNVLLVYIAIQVRGEHRQNREYRSSRGRTPTP
jgi:hypothetical protein